MKKNDDVTIETTELSQEFSDRDGEKEDSKAADKIDEAVVVSLRPEPGAIDAGEAKVVVGKKSILKIESFPGESKACVVWRLDRENVKSVTLDMSHFKVKLLLTNAEEHEDLSFNSSEQCMKFANALHEMASPIEADEGRDDDGEDADDSIFVEQLNEEEQKVLQDFRQKKRRTTGPAELTQENLSIATGESKQGRPPSVVDGTSSNNPG
jgi:hypothetical protein